MGSQALLRVLTVSEWILETGIQASFLRVSQRHGSDRMRKPGRDMACLHLRAGRMTPDIDGIPYSALASAARGDLLPLPTRARRPARVFWWLNPFVLFALGLLYVYRYVLARFIRRQCIYTPTCSWYAAACLKKYGFLRGCYYTVGRLRRCNGALYQGGADPA